MKRTICWHCANARGKSRCPWVEDFTPVEGWEATAKSFEHGNKTIHTFDVHACPLFRLRIKKRRPLLRS